MAKKKKIPHPIDKYVGSRVRMRRLMLGVSLEKLGHELGLSFQQVQKYENGRNRISASRLQAISSVLETPVPFFFEGVPGLVDNAENETAPSPSHYTDFLATADGLKLVRAFPQIDSLELRRSIVRLVEGIVGDGGS